MVTSPVEMEGPDRSASPETHAGVSASSTLASAVHEGKGTDAWRDSSDHPGSRETHEAPRRSSSSDRSSSSERASSEGVVAAPMARALDESKTVALDEVDLAFFDRAAEIERQERENLESFPPVAEEMFARPKPPLPSPAVLARRAKFRKMVGAVVALGALLVAGGFGKALLTARAASAAEPMRPAIVAETLPATESAPRATESRTNESASHARVPTTTTADEETAEDTAEPSDGPSKRANDAREANDEAEANGGAEAESAAAVDNARAKALALLNRGKTREAIPMARAAILQNPEHALGYLYLGSALQDLGRRREAMAAYSDCVRHANKGPTWECGAMGGRK